MKPYDVQLFLATVALIYATAIYLIVRWIG